ncbi:hypothetical protein LWI29_006261 [Acer saccharum]|uniref:KANL2-like probable zinc-finger domain-containing protein n=1 Tax=Acer saccharum TaxID=4024 RepID=A0AA39SI72_ACESA|nr:hypothetical protein LWI29_006261 [Acer saccharum]
MSDPPPPPPPQPLPPEPMMLGETKSDGESADPALLSNSEFLTRHEVLRRRSDRAKRLAGIYRSHYWALMEELRAKYKDYYWMYGKSPYRDDGNVNGNGDGDGAVKEEDGNCTSRREGTGEEVRKCGVSGCKAKAMALTKFCHLHILSDSKQNLYTGCTYVVKRRFVHPLGITTEETWAPSTSKEASASICGLMFWFGDLQGYGSSSGWAMFGSVGFGIDAAGTPVAAWDVVPSSLSYIRNGRVKAM